MSKSYDARAVARQSATRHCQELTLLTNEIHDEVWVAAFEHGVDRLMLDFSNYDTQGPDHLLIREALVADMDDQVLLDTIGREFTHRLRREIERGAGIELDLRYSEMNLYEANGQARFDQSFRTMAVGIMVGQDRPIDRSNRGKRQWHIRQPVPGHVVRRLHREGDASGVEASRCVRQGIGLSELHDALGSERRAPEAKGPAQASVHTDCTAC